MKANSGLYFFSMVIICLAPALGFTQITELELSTRYHPVSGYLAPTDSLPKNGKATQVEVNLASRINFYTKVDSSTGKIRSLGSTVHGRYTGFSRSGYNGLILPSELYSFNAGLYYYATLNKKWAYNIIFNPAINSDLQQVDKNDIFIVAGAVFIRQFSPNFRLGFGAIVHNNLGGFMPWPALMVDWKLGGKFRLDIRTPDKGPGIAHYVGVSYAASNTWNLSFAFQPEVLSYDVTPRADINNRLMSFWQLPFTLSSSFRTGAVEIIPSVGFTALRKYAYGEKKIGEMFTSYPYHGLGANLTFGMGIRYKLFQQ